MTAIFMARVPEGIVAAADGAFYMNDGRLSHIASKFILMPEHDCLLTFQGPFFYHAEIRMRLLCRSDGFDDVLGQFYKGEAGAVTTPDGQVIVLIPKSTYTTELVERVFRGRAQRSSDDQVDVANLDERVNAYIRRSVVGPGGVFIHLCRRACRRILCCRRCEGTEARIDRRLQSS